ncbi:endoglucanase M [Flavonifractor sp. An82]|uniref:M42 family metallopeptidase n=1 Tax=Flavonifractor sp. An82 TaxID=1965660 RepID=UPI000B38BA14|nr:M42 family peptidase [Flavonifractor sp. An82]OUN24050.1 endoglucanase M [Flavonifractor sp. An82]
MKELLRRLCSLPGVASWEDQVRDCVMEVAGQYATELRLDAMGNVIAFKEGARATGSKLLLTAHMDEVGLMVRAITDEGYLKFSAVGSVDRRVLLGKRMLVGPRQIPAVVGLKAYHLVSRDEEKNVPKLDDFYLDIGAKSREEAAKLVVLGDVAAFDSPPEEPVPGLLKGRALDGRIGCAVLLWLMREELPMDCTFVFTAQKEVGARGAFGAAFSVKPEIALVLEGAAAADMAGVPAHKKACALGKGAVLPFMDKGVIVDRKLFETLRSLAEEQHIPWQLREDTTGTGDAMAVQRAASGVRTAVIAAPVRYPRTPATLANAADIEAVLKLTRAFITQLSKED